MAWSPARSAAAASCQTRRSEPEPPYLPERLGEVIDLSILKPVCEPMHLEWLKQALAWLADALPSSAALSFRPNVVFPRHRAVGVEWLKLCGLDVAPQNISLTNGATAGMTVALMSVAPPGIDRGHRGDRAPHPGAAVAPISASPCAGCRSTTTAWSRTPSTRPAATPACGRVFVQPSVINPTATLMSARRPGGDRRGGPQARHRHHRERRARPARR